MYNNFVQPKSCVPGPCGKMVQRNKIKDMLRRELRRAHLRRDVVGPGADIVISTISSAVIS